MATDRHTDSEDDLQAVVDGLATALGQSVLIEDRAQHPVWWSTRGAVDGARLRTVMDRRVDAPAARVVRQFRLLEATAPVRTPAIPEAEMWARWCMPVRSDGDCYGLIWVLDPDESITAGDLAPLVDCAARFAPVMAGRQLSTRDRQVRRERLLVTLAAGPDEQTAAELTELEQLPPQTGVQVDVGGRGGWPLPPDLRVHLVTGRPRPATSGAPVPLLELGVAVHRARSTGRAVAAGAQLESRSWDALGAWRLIVDCPAAVSVADLHPGADVLAALPRSELATTARVVLDLGGDVAAAAQRLHVHRATLYYRLDRIQELTGVDLRSGRSRTDLQLALWLAAYRAAG